MDKKKRTRELIVFAVIVLALLAGCLLTPSGGESEPIQEVMRDAVLHEQNKVSLFGLIEVNPGLISAYIVTGILIVFALVCRLFVIPKFKYVPGRFQLVLEQIVGVFRRSGRGQQARTAINSCGRTSSPPVFTSLSARSLSYSAFRW